MPYSTNAWLLIELCFSVLLVSGFSPASDNAKALPIKEVLRLREFVDWSPVAISPDGKWLAYAVRESSNRSARERRKTHAAVPVWASGTDIYVEDIDGGGTQSLTHHQGNNWLPVWSPDGRYLAFLSDRTKNEPRLWIWDSIRQQLKLASDLEAQTDQIEWMPDSHRLLITAASKEPLVGNSLRTSSSVEEVEKGTESGRLNASVLVYSSSALALRSPKLTREGPWDLDERIRDLALIDIGRRTAKILVHAKRIAAYLLSPDGAAVAYTSPVRFESQGSQQILFSLALIEMSTGDERHIGTQFRLDYDGAEFSWSPDGTQLAVQTGGMDETRSDCYVVAAQYISVRNVTTFAKEVRSHSKASAPLWDEKGNIYLLHDGELWRTTAEKGRAVEVGQVPNREIVRLMPEDGNRLWIPRGKSAVVVAHNPISKQDGFFTIDLDNGESRKLLENGECYTCANVAQQFTVTRRSAELVYFAENAAHHSDLWIAPPNFAKSRRLTHLNPRLDEYQMATPRLIEWLSDDGIALQGALLMPSELRTGTRYPLLVWVYGGVSLSEQFDKFGLGYSGPLNLQLLASRGYAILLPDTPLKVGTPILDLTKTVLPAINKVVSMGIADPEKLGILGHSFGGYGTVALIAQTGRFKAAVELSGYADLVAHYGEMDRTGAAFGVSIDEHGQGRMGGSPWEFPGRYIQNSPLFFLDRVETPLLMVHGSNDTTVAPFLGDELFVALRRLGKDVEYVKYEGEGHIPSSWTLPNQIDLCDRIISWFNLHLKEQTE